MDNNDIQLVGGPCGQHGPYTFYKAFKYTKNGIKRIVTLSEFFFVKLWIDSDLLCIGELQLLWSDKNSDQVLASLRLYFLPENTPEGRLDHGEDEVLAISEKVVLRVEDLITWITADAEWTWGRLANCEKDVREPPKSEDNKNNIIGSLTESSLDFSDVEKERKNSEYHSDQEGPLVVILSYSRYCRYRAMMRRLEGVENEYLKYKIVKALGGFTAYTKNTRVLFCKDTFDYPELEGHELLCNHLAPKLKGRPRGKRKKRSVSPGSESNESESSVSNIFNSSKDKIGSEGGRNGLRCDSTHLRRSARSIEINESKEFLKELAIFMKTNYTPIGKIPSLGYKELDLYAFFTKVQKLGGYDVVTTNRLWKSIFDDMSGHASSTSAATVIRRHYERFLLPYERHMKGEEYKPLPISERRRLKSKAGSSASDAETSESTSRSGNSTPIPQTSNSVSPTTPTTPTENKEFMLKATGADGKSTSLRSVRVKTERQKPDKPLMNNSDNLNNLQNNNNNNEVSSDNASEMTVDSNSETKTKLDDEDVDDVEDNSSSSIVVKSESNSTTTLPINNNNNNNNINNNIKLEKHSNDISAIPEKDAEPLTSAVAPIAAAQKTPEKSHSPVEGKENIPLIKTGDTPNFGQNDVAEVMPYKPAEVSEIIDLESDCYNATTTTATNLNKKEAPPAFLHEVKKRKLDILKEGGLEVTPVRNPVANNSVNYAFNQQISIAKDLRPSVIQPTNQTNNKSIRNDFNNMLPPPPTCSSLAAPVNTLPLTKRPIPSHFDATHAKASTNNKCNSNVTFNGNGPPKVLQSKSIYSYSEKMIYGNPKDDFMSSKAAPPVHTPKFARPRQLGGDILDLTVTSPQKAAVEIVKVQQQQQPQHSHHYQQQQHHHHHLAHQQATASVPQPPQPPAFVPQPRISSNSTNHHNSHSNHVVNRPIPTTNSSMLDGRKLGSNLEITLVGSQNKYGHHPAQVAPSSRTKYNYQGISPDMGASHLRPPVSVAAYANYPPQHNATVPKHHRYHHPTSSASSTLSSSQHLHHHHQPQQGQKRMSSESYINSKMPRYDDKYSKAPLTPISHHSMSSALLAANPPKNGIDVPIPHHPYNSSQSLRNHKSDVGKMQPQQPQAVAPPTIPKHYSQMQQQQQHQATVPTMSPYLRPLYDQKSFYPPISPWDPLYAAAMQSLYPPAPTPFLPFPSSEQLKLYTELLAHSSRGGYSFPVSGAGSGGADGNLPVNNLKKP